MSLLNRLSDAVSQRFFLQNVFLVLISSPVSRLAAVNYLSRTLTEPPIDLVSGSDVGLLIRGVAAVLGDDNMLVRRGGLDLLLRILPIDGAILKYVPFQLRPLILTGTRLRATVTTLFGQSAPSYSTATSP